METNSEELEKITELQILLKGFLANNASLSVPVRQAIANYGGDQELLLKFLRGRKMDIEKAFRSVTHYAEVRISKYPEVFLDEIPDFVLDILKKGIITVLRNQDSSGRTVVLLRIAKWDVSKFCLEEIICAGRYLVDELMNIPDFLTKGTILLTDSNGSTLSHARQFNVTNIVKFVNIFWLAYPIRIKGLYFVNAPFFVRPVYTVVKPFLPAKLRDRVLITSGVSDLHNRIEPDILPESLGGLLSEEEAMTLPTLQLP